MLRSLHEMKGYKAKATDEEVGVVDDFCFDDSNWAVLYIVVDIGSWLADRDVLISPAKVALPDRNNRILPISMSSSEVKQAPGVEAEAPVSKQEAINIEQYHVWAPVWSPIGVPIVYGGIAAAPMVEEEASKSEQKPNPRLRSEKEVEGYHISAVDGEIGHVEDHIVDTDDWTIRYLIVDTRNWLPGKNVILSPDWVTQVDWEQRRISVNLTREQVRNSPGYDKDAMIDREYEEALYDHYGRPTYWES